MPLPADQAVRAQAAPLSSVQENRFDVKNSKSAIFGY